MAFVLGAFVVADVAAQGGILGALSAFTSLPFAVAADPRKRRRQNNKAT